MTMITPLLVEDSQGYGNILLYDDELDALAIIYVPSFASDFAEVMGVPKDEDWLFAFTRRPDKNSPPVLQGLSVIPKNWVFS